MAKPMQLKVPKRTSVPKEKAEAFEKGRGADSNEVPERNRETPSDKTKAPEPPAKKTPKKKAGSKRRKQVSAEEERTSIAFDARLLEELRFQCIREKRSLKDALHEAAAQWLKKRGVTIE